MINKLIDYSLKWRIPTLIIGLIICVMGWISWVYLQKEAYPDVGDTQVTIITTYPGRAAEEVEQLVTRPLERELNSVPKKIVRRSKTIFGLSVIQITFEDGVDDYWARQRVLEKIATADLPEGVEPELAPLTGPTGEIYRYVLESTQGHSAMELRTIQDWVVIPKLLEVSGVADVLNFGGFSKQYHVVTTPEKLFSVNMSLADIIKVIQENNVNTGGNILRQGDQGFAVRGMGAIRTIKDIENTLVSAHDGIPVMVKHVAKVEEAAAFQAGILGFALKDDKGKIETEDQAVQGLVAMRRGENASSILEKLKTRIDDINASELPPGVKIKVTYDRGELVDYTIRTVTHTLFEGVSIVAIVLYFFLGSVRSSLVVAVTIPLSMLFAFFMMKISNIPANLLSLGAIDFGIIVDGAVVMVENIIRRYKSASDEELERGIIPLTFDAAKEVGSEIFFSILIIVMAYIPIFSFERVEGRLFRPMATTLSFAICGSMLFALTVIPVLMTFFYRKFAETKDRSLLEEDNKIYHKLEKLYENSIRFLVDRSKKTLVWGSTLVLAVTLVGWSQLGTEFLPELDEGAINIRCFFPVGYSLQGANKLVPKIKDTLIQHDEVQLAITQLGRNDDGTDPYGPNRLEILVVLKDYKDWKKKVSKKEFLGSLKEELSAKYPGLTFLYSQPIMDNVTEAVTGSVSDLAVLINGQDLTLMREIAKKTIAVIEKIPGATQVGVEQEPPQDQLQISIDREAAARYGVSVDDIQTLIETAIGAKPVSTLYAETGERFPIVTRYSGAYRRDIQQVKNLVVIPEKGTAKIPLSQVANIKFSPGQTIIQRQNGLRQISIRINIQGRDQGGFVKEAKEKVKEAIELPHGYKMEWGGQYENLERASKKLIVVIPLTILLIYGALFLHYRNNRESLIAMSCIPFALIGGIIALLLRGYNFNVSSGVGFISLFGIATMSGVLFVSRLKDLKEKMDLKTAVLTGAITQFKPRLMTILLAALGLIPATMAQGVGSDIQRPLATVIVGGLVTKLVLALFVLPSLYYYFYREKNHADDK
ncbi:efflux RND transporter permease subunit [Peredibacter starrii]|uniref:CusA/CzcA family heavy metal efflux RND transporter n=1 Tax=Peredibacter starrii TaxID=28202 RepID=A0AAX4HUN7_9BACT|nr:CusA/CzcA family heavy metal efflux RND transporter [Peredibacter starrii]WPU66675.1 CusA/CzcA family heavy metal efflux RND transporter [Peredibacter starrii]